jgi:hypothetical protein
VICPEPDLQTSHEDWFVTLGDCILGHREIEKRPRRYNLTLHRFEQIHRLLRARYGREVPNLDDSCLIFEAMARLFRVEMGALYENETQSLVAFDRWIGVWAPWMSEREIGEAWQSAMKFKKRPTAQTLARMFRVTWEERERLEIYHFGACDLTNSEFAAAKRRKKRSRDRQQKGKRRAEMGAIPRKQYEEESVAARCRRMGISRSTFYNRLQRDE